MGKQNEVDKIKKLFDNRLVRVFDPKDAEYKNAHLTGAEAEHLAELLVDNNIRSVAGFEFEESYFCNQFDGGMINPIDYNKEDVDGRAEKSI